MRWDSKARSYQVTPAAYAAHAAERAAVAQWSIAHYVTLTGLPDGNVITASPAYAAFREFAAPNPRLFAQLRQAIVGGHAVALTYRSMREPAPHLREIEPHSLVRAGPRWHVRAYSLATTRITATSRWVVSSTSSRCCGPRHTGPATIQRGPRW